MTIIEGETLLAECLTACKIDVPFEDFIYYTYGNRVQAGHYSDTLPHSLDMDKVRPTMKYVVKCFLHLDIFVVWPIEPVIKKGKFVVYKKDLVEIEADENIIYQEKKTEKKIDTWYLRGREGVMRFLTRDLAKDDTLLDDVAS